MNVWKDPNTGQTVVQTSHSSASSWQNCPMYAWLHYCQGLGEPIGREGEGPAPSAAFGKGIHDSAYHWTLTGDLERAFEKFDESFGIPLEREEGNFTRARGRATLRTYATRYGLNEGKDPLEIVHLEQNGVMVPQVEIRSKDSLVLVDKPDLRIIYEVVLDCLVIDPEERGIWVKDIKTTGQSLSTDGHWLKAQTRSDQWPGYTMFAAQLYEGILGIPVLGVILDLIYTRKKVIVREDMMRHSLPRNQLHEGVLAQKMEALARQVIIPIWTGSVQPWGNPPQSCIQYNRGCKFLPHCKANPEAIDLSFMGNFFGEYNKEK